MDIVFVRNCLPSPHTFHHISVILKPVSLPLHVLSLLHVSLLLRVSSLLHVSSLDVEYIYKSMDNSLKSQVTHSGLQVRFFYLLILAPKGLIYIPVRAGSPVTKYKAS